ncbi:phage capsid protein [Mycolicibacterium moriokaense]|uniref:Phage capsid protein n=1 Tax=Mycolicibacterium moriokaense TaxID=39691 RepID=A0AAD1HAI3_9MYCO|nr:phage major capsid protein [Mycolicibacterium moriokaense]MCV7039696.1 phage major capsid protein [Mycolicibacterium moriokaense]ORB19860.1 phage capsid protein [Mycolicibacterium moriokaense]BBX01858.1 phage capsid protein [Mycolicibacterium moriokaense]
MKTIEELLTEQRTLVDSAEGRNFTDEEAQRYEALEAELKATQRSEEIRKRQAAYEAPNGTIQAAVHVAPAKSDDTLERAFDHYVRTGKENADLQELRAQSVGTPSAGGYTVPETFLNKLIDVRKTFGGIQSVAEVLETETGEPIRYPTLNDTANTGVQVDELTAPNSGGADLVFGEVTLGAYRFVAPGASNNPLRVSRELLQDSAIDIQALIARKLGERIERKLAAEFATGVGTTAPLGIITGGTALTNTTLTYDKLVDASHSVDAAYRQGAVWIISDTTLAAIEKLKDLDDRPLLNAHNDGIAVARTNRTLLGYPVVVDNAIANYAATGSVKWGVFGNVMEGMVIRRVRGAELIANPYTAANDGAVEFTLHVRADATVQNTAAFRVLQAPAS